LHPGSIPGEASKQINGLLEVSHWAKKLVSHPSEFCFAAESAAALGLWGRAEEKRPQGEEWISAAEALALVKIPRQHAARAICSRAHAGLVRARAERYVSDNQISYNIDVPIEFWWAEGGAALTQNWHTGDSRLGCAACFIYKLSVLHSTALILSDYNQKIMNP
jgi:hypothetical protein